MKLLSKVLLWSLVVSGTVFCVSAADDYEEAAQLERAGNTWKVGEPVPDKLLKYHTSEDGSCFPNPRGTAMLFQSITNYALLWEVALLPQIDARVFTNSVNQAVVVAGPNRFFLDLAMAIKQHPELEQLDRIKMLKTQSKVPHAVVDSLYITFADMPPDSARKVLGEISLELRAGKPWRDVYEKAMEKNSYPYEEKLSNGRIIKGTRSKIGNLGDFVLPANRNALFSYREHWLPTKHREQLFTAKAGDILILFDKEDLGQYSSRFENETGERYVLYRVREVYGGK